MSRQTVSHADRFQAGNAVVFNKPAEFENALRGIPIMLVAVESFPAVIRDPAAAIITALANWLMNYAPLLEQPPIM